MQMRRRRFAARCASCALALPLLLAAQAALAQDAGGASPKRGREVYQAFCVKCHGVRGDGQGPIGKTLDPPPRDFASGRFKFGKTDRDLFEVITHGAAIKGGDPIMNSWGDMISERDRWALVAFIRSLKK
jgi:mono/diheme cytochrome c family protein